MGWVRARRGLGGWLALFALALQLALSFGHIHPEDFATAKAGGAGAGQLSGAAGTPSHTDRDGDGHCDCAICAVMHLAGTLLVPAPPQAALLVEPLAVRLDAAETSGWQRAHATVFQARGPPQA
jgi:hypothetical protein